MTSVGSLGPAQLQSWMVARLFGSQGAGVSSSQSSQPGVSVGASGSNVSNQTWSAILTLPLGGGKAAAHDHATGSQQAPADPLSFDRSKLFAPGGQLKSITQSNDIIKANQAMTSDQVNAAMYGKGIARAGWDVDSPNTTFGSLMSNWQSTINDQLKISNDTTLSQADRNDALESATQAQAFVTTVTDAYKSGTLRFQKASDIEGLDFSESTTYLGNDPNKAADIGVVGTQDYNRDFYENRPNKYNSSMLDTGSGVTLYLTW